MQLVQRKFLLVSVFSLIESTMPVRVQMPSIHANNNVNIDVTINKNVYYIQDGGEIANKDNWEKVLPVPRSEAKPNSTSKKKKPKTEGGRIEKN